MRLLLLFIALFGWASFAENWIKDDDIALANAQTPNTTSYPTQSACTAANPGHTCYEFTGQNLRYRKISGGVWVDDSALKTAYDDEQAELALRYSPKVAFARVSDGSDNDCTTSPCTIDKSVPIPNIIVSATRSSEGVYGLVFETGAWIEAPVCVTGDDKGSGDFCVMSGLATTTAATIKCYGELGFLSDTRFVISCGGK